MTVARPKDRASRETEFVLPKPPRAPTDLIVEGGADGDGLAPRAERGLQTFGDRVLGLLECQDLFLAELRQAVRDARSAAVDERDVGPNLEGILGILDWCEAVQADLHNEARRARAGQQPIDLADLCREVALEVKGARADLDLLVQGESRRQIWAPLASCQRLLRTAIELVLERTRGQGCIALEIGDDDDGPRVRIRGLADPGGDVPAPLVSGFRSAAGATGAVILPDELGPGGSGMILRFPGAVVGAALAAAGTERGGVWPGAGTAGPPAS